MCGRGNHAGLTWAELVGWMRGLTPPAIEIAQRFNVPPTASVPIIRGEGTGWRGGFARWGLVPHWHRGPLRDWRAATFNARIETVASAPSFRDALGRAGPGGRCLVPFAGYYEWQTLGAVKQPFYVHPAGNAPALLAAGLVSPAALPDFAGDTCTILTEPARAPLEGLHDRMPLLVSLDSAAAWLAGEAPDAVARLEMAQITWHRVGAAVGKVANDGPELIEPMQAAAG